MKVKKMQAGEKSASVQIEVKTQVLIFGFEKLADFSEMLMTVSNAKGIVRDKANLKTHVQLGSDEYPIKTGLKGYEMVCLVELAEDGYLNPTLFLELEIQAGLTGYLDVFVNAGSKPATIFNKFVKSVHNTEILVDQSAMFYFKSADVDYIQTNTVNDVVELEMLTEIKEPSVREYIGNNDYSLLFIPGGSKIGINKETVIYRQFGVVVNNVVEKLQFRNEIKKLD